MKTASGWYRSRCGLHGRRSIPTVGSPPRYGVRSRVMGLGLRGFVTGGASIGRFSILFIEVTSPEASFLERYRFHWVQLLRLG